MTRMRRDAGMYELAGALLLILLSLQCVKLLIKKGIIFGSRRQEEEREPKPQRTYGRETRREQEAETQRQREQEREAERWRQQAPAKPANENEWWAILGVSPDAGADEIRRSYLRKIHESHPDRVAWLAPELLPAAERRSRTLNAAYTEATRSHRRRNQDDDSGGPQP